MSAVDLVGTIADLELRQRVRSTAWYVLLGVAAAVLLGVTALLLATAAAFGRQAGAQIVPVIVLLVLLLGTLVTPALSGGAVNGDRDAGTLATTQVTLVTAAHLVLGKFLAAWAAALAFLVVAVPFLLVAVLAGGVSGATVLVSLGVSVVELGVVAAIGVGLSAVIARPIFSVVTTYLVVAALSLGTLVAFGLAGLAFPRTITDIDRSPIESSTSSDPDAPLVCGPPETSTRTDPSYDRVWGLLAANPYVVLIDAVPARFSAGGSPDDLFTGLQVAERSAQIAPPTIQRYDACHDTDTPSPTAQQLLARTVPSWFVGLAIHVVLAVAALLAAVRALRTPARRLARGSRIA